MLENIKRPIELCAPAKDLECGLAAIKCGADAVYIGGSVFGAREAAGNSIEDIEKLIRFAHQYWAKVYVTLNTILTDDELEEARRLICRFDDVGADAVIIQDMGLLELDLPDIPLFASTQTDNDSVDKIRFLEKVGFSRAILARELSVEQIRDIRAGTSIELEAFIHGSLCVCCSGCCYMSYAIGGRSANRGRCAQPCRRKYSLEDDKGRTLVKDRYLLSLKDYCAYQFIPQLIQAGVSSFKIEGRLKDASYVKNTVSFYRQAIDRYLETAGGEKTSRGKSHISFTPDPHRTFNRGFTSYFLQSRQRDILSPYTPKSVGEYIGRVNSVKKDFFTVKSDKRLNNGDGICFFDDDKNLVGTNINTVDGDRIIPNKQVPVQAGTEVYRNLDCQFEKELANSRIERKVDISFVLKQEGGSLVLYAADEDGNKAEVRMPSTGQFAQNPDDIRDRIITQLKKLGGTIFECSNAEVQMPQIPFIQISAINQMRRQAVDELAAVRSANHPRIRVKRTKSDCPYISGSLDYHGNVLNKMARRFYERRGVKDIAPAMESGSFISGSRVMVTKHCLKFYLDLCPKEGKAAAHTELWLIDEDGRRYRLQFDCKQCRMEIYFGSGL